MQAPGDLELGRRAGAGHQALQDRQARPHERLTPQPVHGAPQKSQRSVVPECALLKPRLQLGRVARAEVAEAADRHRASQVPASRPGPDLQAVGVNGSQIDVELVGYQRGGGLWQLADGRGNDPQPPKRADRRGDRKAGVEIAICRDGFELVVG